MTRATDSKQRPNPAWFALPALLLVACDRGATARGLLPPEKRTSTAEQQPKQEADLKDLSAKIVELKTQVENARIRQQTADALLEQAREELAVSEARRVDREREWMEYSSLLDKLPSSRLPGGKLFPVDLPGSAPPAAETSSTAADAVKKVVAPDPLVQARSLEIARALRTLITLEQIRGLDLLECGTLEGAAIGPLVLRMLDGEGHPAGSLFANHLRLEASRSARTLTLVLEDGYETRAGVKTPFETVTGGSKADTARRIVLEGVDPKLWATDLHELFGDKGLDLSGDDGLWDLTLVKQQLNDLFKTQSAGGTYRLRALGGVQDGCLLDVHLERLNEKGDVERRLFADRMRIARSGGGVEITLENGVQVRGSDQRVPFLDGRFRIILPAADVEIWTRAGLPGLSPPP